MDDAIGMREGCSSCVYPSWGCYEYKKEKKKKKKKERKMNQVALLNPVSAKLCILIILKWHNQTAITTNYVNR